VVAVMMMTDDDDDTLCPCIVLKGKVAHNPDGCAGASEIETQLQIDNGSGSVAETGDEELLEDLGENEAGPWIFLAHSRRTAGEWPQPLRIEPNLGGLSRKLGFLDSDSSLRQPS
jgi:hypothetical protein